MERSSHVKIVVFVPATHADIVRKALGDAGAGAIGDYTHCSFSVTGVGRYTPLPGADPAIGKVGKKEAVVEERIEVISERAQAKKIVDAMKAVHPYEEVAFEVYAVEGPGDI